MDASAPVPTPVESRIKPHKAKDGDELIERETYKSAVGCLLNLFTKPGTTLHMLLETLLVFHLNHYRYTGLLWN